MSAEFWLNLLLAVAGLFAALALIRSWKRGLIRDWRAKSLRQRLIPVVESMLESLVGGNVSGNMEPAWQDLTFFRHREKAEELYLYGIENTISKVVLLKNYRILLQLENRLEEAEQISRKLAKLDDPNPFNWIYIAEDYFAKQDYNKAIVFFKKAVKQAPYLHHGHLGLAKTYYQLGWHTKAERALNDAISHSPNGNMRERYQGKLNSLLKISHNQTN